MNIEKIRDKICDGQAILIVGNSNRQYITGFKSSAGLVYISKHSAVFLIDFRYFEKAKREVVSFETVLLTNEIKQLNDLIISDNVKTLFIETDVISVLQYNKYVENINCEISKDNTLVNALEELRSIKSDDELTNIITAQSYAEKTFEHILNVIKIGKTEKEIMLEMEMYMRKLGSEGVAFDLIVVSGKNSSLPHGVPTDKPIQNGDFVTMDFGARYNGYCSDMTRTVAVGNITEKQKEVYDIVLNAQLKAMDKIKAGAICKDIDNEARSFIYNSGYEGCFGHGLGHSLGIDVHENPNFNTRCETILKEGTVMTVEPGIYIQNEFGVRIEDMVLVKKDGYVNLTKTPKNLIIL